jgi:outer membrane protein with beta-barrel domain
MKTFVASVLQFPFNQEDTYMTRWISLLAVVLSFASFDRVDRAFAQEAPAGPGQAEITIIPGGAVVFTQSKDASAPSFGNYQVGGAVAYNFNRVVALEGEVGSSVGLSQTLDFGYSSSVRTPDMLSYNGNLVVAIPTGTSVVPYATGGVGGLSLFSRQQLGINQTETLFTSNVGGGLKWYAGRWGLRGDYRFIAAPSRDKNPAFFGTRARYGHRVYGAVLLNLGR